MRENLTSGSMRGSRSGPLGSYGLVVRPSTRKGGETARRGLWHLGANQTCSLLYTISRDSMWKALGIKVTALRITVSYHGILFP